MKLNLNGIASPDLVAGARRMLAYIAAESLGQPRPDIRARLESISDYGELEALGRRLRYVRSWEELLQVRDTSPTDAVIAERMKILSKAKLFQSVEWAILETVARGSKIRTIAHGDILFNEGDDGDYMYVIDVGSLVVEQTYPVGTPGHAVTRTAGDAIGEMALLTNTARMATVRASSLVRMLEICKSDLLAAVAQSQRLAGNVRECMADRLRDAWERIHDLHRGKLLIRVARKLLELAYAAPDAKAGGPVTLRMAQTDLARFTGADIYQVNKALAALKALKIVNTGDGEIKATDLKALRKIVEDADPNDPILPGK